jgi:hypothetical protein
MCKQKNIQPEKPCKGTFNVRVAQRLHEKATIAAADLGIMFNKFGKQALEHELISKDINISLGCNSHIGKISLHFEQSSRRHFYVQ